MIDRTTLLSVTPAKAGVQLIFSGVLSFGGVAKGSLTPDQVRGDGCWEAVK